jgi:hypothetical protein
MLEKANAVKTECERIMREDGRKLECEVWHQQGNGSYRCVPFFLKNLQSTLRIFLCSYDMMSKRLYKTYVNLTNVIVRVSDGTAEGKEHALLVNAHLDSTLPSPGAADDAVCVGIMLECIRVLLHTPEWSPKHAIIFRECRSVQVSREVTDVLMKSI